MFLPCHHPLALLSVVRPPPSASCMLPAASRPLAPLSLPLSHPGTFSPYHLYGTRSSPCRRVIRASSRCSRNGMAYFRETPKRSFIVPTLMLGVVLK
jgi:hypothetical protein